MESSMFTYYFGLQTNNVIYLVAQIVPDLTIGNTFSWLLWPFYISHHCVCVCVCVCVALPVWYYKMLQAQDVFSLPQL